MPRANRQLRRRIWRLRKDLGAVGGKITIGVGGFLVTGANILRTYLISRP
jgi:hypothetical protein